MTELLNHDSMPAHFWGLGMGLSIGSSLTLTAAQVGRGVDAWFAMTVMGGFICALALIAVLAERKWGENE